MRFVFCFLQETSKFVLLAVDYAERFQQQM